MSTDHRKPVVAFVVLAFAAAAVIGIQRAEAQAGRFLAAVIGTSVRVQGTVPTDVLAAEAQLREAAFRPVLAGIDRAVLGERLRPERVEPPAPQERPERMERSEHSAAPARAADHRSPAKPLPAAAEHGRRLGHDKSSGDPQARRGPSARARQVAAVDPSQRGRAARDVLPPHTPRR